MKWLRLYHDTPNDPKWRLVSVRSGKPVGDVLAVWMQMLVCASEAEDRGTLEDWDDEIVAAMLGYAPAAVTAIRASMQGLVLDGLRLTGWDKRQRATDDATERTANYRKRLHAGTGRKSTPYVAAEIIQLDGGACIYCGATEKLCVDHMVPIICGGDHEQDNLACACRACNSGKAGRTPEQARYEIRSAAARERYMRALNRLGVDPHTVAPKKPEEQRSPLTATPCDDVTVTGADVTVTASARADFRLTEVSVASATAPPAAPEPSLKSELFGKCLVWLVAASDRNEKSLRPMIGRWIGRHGEGAVLAAIVLAQREAAVSPVDFVEKVLRSGSKDHGKANSDKHERYRNAFAGAFADLLDPRPESTGGECSQLSHGYH